MRVFFCLTGETDNISCPVWVPYCSFSFWGGKWKLAFPSFKWFPSCMQLSVLHWIFRRPSEEPLSSFLLCFFGPASSCCFYFPRVSSLFPQLRNLQYTVQVLSSMPAVNWGIFCSLCFSLISQGSLCFIDKCSVPWTPLFKLIFGFFGCFQARE